MNIQADRSTLGKHPVPPGKCGTTRHRAHRQAIRVYLREGHRSCVFSAVEPTNASYDLIGSRVVVGRRVANR